MKNRRKEYIPNIAISTIALLIVSFIGVKTYEWIKNYGDFADKAFVLEAKAECIATNEEQLADYKNKQDLRLNRLEDKIDKIYLILLEKK